MAYISKYKGVLVTPAIKETLNDIRKRVPNCTEAQLMTHIITEYTQNCDVNRLVEILSSTLAAQTKTPRVKKEAVLAPAAKVAAQKPRVKKDKKAEPVAVVVDDTADQITEMNDADEPPIRVVVAG